MSTKISFSALILTLILVLTGCVTTTPATSPQNAGPQLKITVTGIPPEYNGKLGWIQLDTGSSDDDPSVAWAMGNINSASITFNILDWDTDQPYNKNGNYYVTFFLWEDIDAASAQGVEALWQGIIVSKDIGERTSIEFSEFIKI